MTYFSNCWWTMGRQNAAATEAYAPSGGTNTCPWRWRSQPRRTCRLIAGQKARALTVMSGMMREKMWWQWCLDSVFKTKKCIIHMLKYVTHVYQDLQVRVHTAITLKGTNMHAFGSQPETLYEKRIPKSVNGLMTDQSVTPARTIYSRDPT